MLISILTVLSILTAVSSLTVVYPKVVLTVVFIPTVVYILTVVTSLSDYSPQHSPHSYFHVTFICAYPAVRVIFYAYVNMLGRNDLIINYLTICWKRKQSLCNYAKGRNQRRNIANDSFGKGFHVLKDHVLNRLMTGWCPCKSLQLRPKFHSLFLQNSFDFQKSATHLKDLNPHLECTDVSFNPENGAFSKIKKLHTDRDTQTKWLHSRACALKVNEVTTNLL